MDGGTTPSVGMIRIWYYLVWLEEVVKNSISIPVNVIIRPRGGDFLYNEDEVIVTLMLSYRWK